MVRNKSSKRVCLQESSAVAFRLGRLAADRTLLLPLLRHLDDAISNDGNPSFALRWQLWRPRTRLRLLRLLMRREPDQGAL